MIERISQSVQDAVQVVKRRLSKTGPIIESGSVLALDIGTDAVKALTCLVNYDESKVYVKGVGRQKQRLGDMYNGGIIDIDRVLENARVAVEESEMKANMRAPQVVIGIAGELVKGTTVTVEYMRDKPQEKMTLTELRNLVTKLQGKAFEQARRAIARSTALHEVDIKLVHTSLVQVSIDGYRVSNPIGFKGRHVVMSIFNAFAPLVHVESLVAIGEGLSKELLSVVVEPYAVAHASDMEEGGQMSSIFIDVGGGSTDVAIMINGGVLATKMFGIGGRVFTRRISKHLHVPFLEAEQLKLDYSAGKITQESKKKELKKLIDSDVETWLDGLHHTLYSLQKEEYLPSRIYLSGGGSLLKELKKGLETEGWTKGLKFIKKPKVAYFKPSQITRVEDHTKTLKTSQDVTPLALANVAFDLAGEDRILEKVLKQVTKVVGK